MKEVALARIAHGRSGDKGDTLNCGIIARKPEYYPIIAQQVTAERVKQQFGDFCQGTAKRYALPKIHAFNFV
ncbi:MAG: AtuA-related protein, partial [Gammaproteobacteria bacterium]